MVDPHDAETRPDLMSRVLHGIASIALVAMMLVVVADVFLRFVFNVPVRGAYDMVSICLLVMVFFGIGPVIVSRREILIDLLDQTLPAPVLKALMLIAAIGTLAVFLFLAWSMVDPARDAYRYGDRSLELDIPVWALWALAFVGLLGVFWAAGLGIDRAIRGSGGGDDPGANEEGAL